MIETKWRKWVIKEKRISKENRISGVKKIINWGGIRKRKRNEKKIRNLKRRIKKISFGY